MKNFILHHRVRLMLISGMLCCCFELSAGNDDIPPGARASGMGGASVIMPGVWANFGNQANLALLTRTSIGIHHEFRFGLRELSATSIAFAKPAANGTFGLCYSVFGYSGFRQSKAGLSYSLRLFKGIAAGIQLDYLNIFSPDNSRANACTFELGILADLNKEFKLAVHIFNPANIHYNGKNGEAIPPEIKMGLGYKPIESLTIIIQTDEKLGGSPVFRAGIEFGLGRILLLRTGISSNPWENSFGLGIKLKNVKIDISVRRHPILGFSPACSIGYEFP